MKFAVSLFIATAAAVSSPAPAAAAETTMVVRDIPVGAGRALAGTAPQTFDLVGLHWRGEGMVLFRTRARSGAWTRWREARPEALDLPDSGTAEAARAGTWKVGNPFWVGRSVAIEYRFRGRVERLRAHFVRADADAIPRRSTAIAGSPALITRAAWGANESIRRGAPVYADALRFSVVHHTAGSNSYTRAQSAAIVRAIQLYHVRGNGWNDIGYNVLVDRFGQVFEGRYGGVERNVVGAHAEGFNTGSVGVAVLGTYSSAQVSAQALSALSALLAWRLDVAHVDPLARLSWISGGNPRFPAGTPVPLAAVAGHRDTGSTSCPGAALYRRLRSLAGAVSEIGLPKLYDPLVTGRPGGLVRFRARLSTLRPWSVTVVDAGGAVVATGQGEGNLVDWTWDATAAPPGRYAYTIDAGIDVRPATGVVGQRATVFALTNVRASPRTFTPNGDSVADSTTITYTISVAARVTATLRDALGQTLATLFTEEKRAGRHTVRFTAQGIPDGRYAVVISARATNGREARVEAPVVIDRTLAAVSVSHAAVSPNGDGRNDDLAVTFVLASSVPTTVRVLRGSRTISVVYDGLLSPGQQHLSVTPPRLDGRYAVVVEAAGQWGTRAQTARFVVDLTRPRLRLLSARQMRFSAGEPGTLVVNSGTQTARVAVRRAGWVVVPQLAGSGRFSAVLWDAAGNASDRVRYP